ncbi:2-hydroxychromene-2-carboxylate isomerase [Terasakiella sp. A23]|uniref:2-hydroxychromene-2-carboxylate isomerase n=1 Tax=Terasakiella sp. FCG-A23 TaxID=3080561 RepID=UPI002953F3A8|nr:2-hydroxychromene-2-carboxylate isomerase [Terasakiella sp. A23]MDV7338528.1 2-hydroxychromene-2-carboxylate isomerase [Terasakiella sp. A23]
MTDKIIEFYFEFGSPYGYFAANQIEAIGEEFGRKVIWKPYMLGSAFEKTGAVPLRDVPLKGDYCLNDWERISAYTGTPWHLPAKFPTGILAAPRGFYWLMDQGREELAIRFAKAAYKAYFADRRPMWTNEETAEVAAECGIDKEEFLSAVQDKHVKARLIEEGQKAIDRGVFGSPFIIIDGESFWGWDRLPMIRDWLKQGKWS